MSFSVYLDSANGIQVSGAQSQILYNFDFNNTPKHDGAYKVWMSFASETQDYGGAPPMFGCVNINLGVLKSYTPISNTTATRTNQMFGIIRPSLHEISNNIYIPGSSGTQTWNVPINSGTAAYTVSATSTAAAMTPFIQGKQTIDAKHGENPPVYLQSKPTNNQFIVKLTLRDGLNLYSYLTTHYALVLHFEAIF